MKQIRTYLLIILLLLIAPTFGQVTCKDQPIVKKLEAFAKILWPKAEDLEAKFTKVDLWTDFIANDGQTVIPTAAGEDLEACKSIASTKGCLVLKDLPKIDEVFTNMLDKLKSETNTDIPSILKVFYKTKDIVLGCGKKTHLKSPNMKQYGFIYTRKKDKDGKDINYKKRFEDEYYKKLYDGKTLPNPVSKEDMATIPADYDFTAELDSVFKRKMLDKGGPLKEEWSKAGKHPDSKIYGDTAPTDPTKDGIKKGAQIFIAINKGRIQTSVSQIRMFRGFCCALFIGLDDLATHFDKGAMKVKASAYNSYTQYTGEGLKLVETAIPEIAVMIAEYFNRYANPKTCTGIFQKMVKLIVAELPCGADGDCFAKANIGVSAISRGPRERLRGADKAGAQAKIWKEVQTNVKEVYKKRTTKDIEFDIAAFQTFAKFGDKSEPVDKDKSAFDAVNKKVDEAQFKKDNADLFKKEEEKEEGEKEEGEKEESEVKKEESKEKEEEEEEGEKEEAKEEGKKEEEEGEKEEAKEEGEKEEAKEGEKEEAKEEGEKEEAKEGEEEEAKEEGEKEEAKTLRRILTEEKESEEKESEATDDIKVCEDEEKNCVDSFVVDDDYDKTVTSDGTDFKGACETCTTPDNAEFHDPLVEKKKTEDTPDEKKTDDKKVDTVTAFANLIVYKVMLIVLLVLV